MSRQTICQHSKILSPCCAEQQRQHAIPSATMLNVITCQQSQSYQSYLENGQSGSIGTSLHFTCTAERFDAVLLVSKSDPMAHCCTSTTKYNGDRTVKDARICARWLQGPGMHRHASMLQP
eukprot:1156443-Pelagomonas_calceolata.AAC.5